VLLGTWLGVTGQQGIRVRVRTAGPDGWVDLADTRQDCGLKIFFIDVGQGDGSLIEAPGKRILLDGGPNRNMRSYLRGWQYRWLLDSGKKVHIDAVFVSHFDADHYAGLTKIIEDPGFTFGTVYHNGIARFSGKASARPPGHNTDLGKTSNGALVTSFNSISSRSSPRSAG